MNQINLSHAIYGSIRLSEEDIDSLMQLLTSRCNPRTKHAVRTALMYLYGEKSHGIYERIIKDPKSGRWSYIAGQSYTDEIRTVRSLLRGW